MSTLPRIEPGPSGAPGSLAGDFVLGEPAALALLHRSADASSPRTGPRAGQPLSVGDYGCSSPGAEKKLTRVLGGEGMLVTTGQQPALFLGPLYVIYKALSAIELAAVLEAHTGRPCLAAFWIASDDHDWDEVAGTHVIDTANELRELRLSPPTGRAGRAVGSSMLTESVLEPLDQLQQVTPQSEFAESCIRLLRDAYQPDATFGAAFASALAGLFANRDFVWIDAADPAVKRSSASLFRRCLEEGRGWEEALRAGSEQVRAAGYQPTIPPLPEATPLFFDTGDRRERVYSDGTTARLGRKGPTLPVAELVGRLASDPDPFSPNVALRPVLESWLMPVGATVLGPGEIAYWAQLRELFERAALPFPEVHARQGWTLIEAKIDKLLDRWQVEPAELLDGGEATGRRIAREARPERVEGAARRLQGSIEEGLGSLREAVADELPGIRSAVEKTGAQIERAVSELEGRINASVRERERVGIEQVRRAALHLFPGRKPQERIQSPIYFLSRYGPTLLAALSDRTRHEIEKSLLG